MQELKEELPKAPKFITDAIKAFMEALKETEDRYKTEESAYYDAFQILDKKGFLFYYQTDELEEVEDVMKFTGPMNMIMLAGKKIKLY